MPMSAAAAGSNDTAVNSISQELACSAKIKNITWKINQEQLF